MNSPKPLILVAFSILFSGFIQLPTFANDDAALCKNRNYGTEFAIQTEDFDAAICSSGYISPQTQCYIPSKYFYLGQNRKTRDSIKLPAFRQNDTSLIFKAVNNNYTYQMATSGGYAPNRWTSLSVFLNGKRIYHNVVNRYYGYLDC